MTNMKSLLSSHKPEAIIPSTSSSKSDITLPFSERTSVTNYNPNETKANVVIAAENP